MQNLDLITIGQGYAGLKVANLAAQKGLKVAAVEANFPGGLVMSINHLDPAPHGEPPCGPELTGAMALANMDGGVQNIEGAATGLARAADGQWEVTTEAGVFQAPHIVIASGARLRRLGVPGEAELAGRGVSECADCDGPMYHGKDAVVVGGGDSAFQEAAALTVYASNVALLVRGAAPRARADLIEHVEQNGKIALRRETVVKEILGDFASGVTGVRVETSGVGEEVIPCSVLFAFVGLDPNSEYLPPEIERDAHGAVRADENLQTTAPGAYAIGAVRSGFGGLLSDADADANRVVAALLAARHETIAPSPAPKAAASRPAIRPENLGPGTYTAESIETLKRQSRIDAQIAGERGQVNDLSREGVIVSIGAPVGSISGWVGALSWQVWLEPYHGAGEVSARIDRGERLDWRLDTGLSREALLDSAKDRLIPLVEAERLARLARAQANAAQLEAALD